MFIYFKCIKVWHLLWNDIFGLTFQTSGSDIRACNVLTAEGIDDWKVVALFIVNGHSKCHGPNVFGIRLDGVDNQNVIDL